MNALTRHPYLFAPLDLGFTRLKKPRSYGVDAYRSGGCCQADANQSPQFAVQRVLGDEKVPPLAKGGIAFLFESNSGFDVPFEVEVTVH